MASYTFETMTASDGAAYISADSLFFESATVATLGVIYAPTSPLNPAETITLTSGGHAVLFAADQLSAASLADHLSFAHGGNLLVGTAGDNMLDGGAVTASPGQGMLLYGFDGNDTIHGSAAHDTIDGGAGDDWLYTSSFGTDGAGHFIEHDYINGGAGNDEISGGAGNDHLYGNSSASTAGDADGGDTIFGNQGNDYIQGNAGSDLIYGGFGNDRLYGGGGDDTISGDGGNDYIQGNKGNDKLSAHDGNDTIHGGAGDDLISGYDGDTLLFGDDGNDTIWAGVGHTVLTGGRGADAFMYQDDAGRFGGPAHPIDQITDFTSGEDRIGFIDLLRNAIPVDHVYHAEAGHIVTSADAAQAYAEQLLDAGTFAHEIAAIQVGGDTYLFYNYLNYDVTGADAAHSINSAIELVGVTASSISTADFV